MEMKTVYTKARKNCPSVGTKYLYGIDSMGYLFIEYTERQAVNSFKVGDLAEYDAYNLVYTGRITKITDKTVTIYCKTRRRSYRLSMYEFCWRNWDFDAADVAARNEETSYYI